MNMFSFIKDNQLSKVVEPAYAPTSSGMVLIFMNQFIFYIGITRLRTEGGYQSHRANILQN